MSQPRFDLKNKNLSNGLLEQLKDQPFEFIFAKNGQELIKKAVNEKADLIIAENDLGIIDTLTVKNISTIPFKDALRGYFLRKFYFYNH